MTGDVTGARLVVGPFNRVEGDLEVTLDVAGGRVARAQVNAPLYRGFERMLEGRDPRDALVITPRICGICSISQSTAAAHALAAAMGLTPTPQGALAAALIHAAENVADHLTHFHLFFMPDFARPAYAGRPWHARAVARFIALEGGAQRAAVQARAELLHAMGLMAGKWPHTLGIQPGGVTRAPGPREKARLAATLRAFRRYLETVLFGGRLEDFCALKDVAALMRWPSGDVALFLGIAADLGLAGLGRGAGRYLSFGAYPLADGPAFAAGTRSAGAPGPVRPAEIAEDLSHAWMLGGTAHPLDGMTTPDEGMAAPAYSWCKAPRLAGQPMEVGALARQVVDGHPLALALAEEGGVVARVGGRLLELARTQILMEAWVAALAPGESFMAQCSLPRDGQGAGMVEAARGALGHWLRIRNGKIANYQIIAQTTWNFSPRDAADVPGPLEAALEGTQVEGPVPLAVQHVVRSFDPGMVCTVH
ncbi:nickel-dependent hydrogenase large subunit [Rhodobacter calidifons]|uniref:Nickel-dependent hydrogenase large subunit n=1 Tax=Rhodobacter calidifons TaxID=2715277 RepID=A0ABX0GA35_9RHOB|nr:nickel-dependent hydrogenase large subunit [Rhodobacter calidifons]NHB77782.1 nickel-dependent hydrogenase large subunit [Rhodobacter calidifons]